MELSMKFDSIKLGDRVQIIQNPDSFNHVIKQFEGRIGVIVDKVETKWNDSSWEYRVRVSFGDHNDLWTVSQTGEFHVYKIIHSYYWGI